MMRTPLRNEIRTVALRYDLRYKITNDRMEEYLRPAYFELREKHPELNFMAFIDEVVKIRAEERRAWKC